MPPLTRVRAGFSRRCQDKSARATDVVRLNRPKVNNDIATISLAPAVLSRFFISARSCPSFDFAWIRFKGEREWIGTGGGTAYEEKQSDERPPDFLPTFALLLWRERSS